MGVLRKTVTNYRMSIGVSRGAAVREEKNNSFLESVKLRIYQYEVTTGEFICV